MTAQTHDQNQMDCGRKAQTSPYAQSMDAIRLTPKQKAELVDAVLAQYAAGAVAWEAGEPGAVELETVASAAAALGTAGPAHAFSPQAASMPAEPSPTPATPTPRAKQAHGALANGRPAAPVTSPALPQAPSPRPSRISRRSFVALLSAAAVGAGAAGAAFALSQAHVSVSDILKTFFGGESGSGATDDSNNAGGETVSTSEPAIGSPIGASATCDGVTVTVDSAVGDATNAAVVLTIEREDGSDLGATRDPDTGMPMVEFGMDSSDYQAAITIDGITKCSTGRFTYDADPSDNAVQVMLNISLNAPLSLIGRTAHLHIADLRDSGSGAGSIEEWPVIAQGPWDIDFTLDYEDSTCLYTCDGGVVSYESIDATLASARVSKVCATLEFAIVIHADLAESLDEQMGWESEFVNLPFSLAMDDGQEFSNGYDETSTGPGLGAHSQITVDYSRGLDPDDPSGDFNGVVTRQLFFKRVIDPSRVSAVVLNDTRIELERESADE